MDGHGSFDAPFVDAILAGWAIAVGFAGDPIGILCIVCGRGVHGDHVQGSTIGDGVVWQCGVLHGPCVPGLHNVFLVFQCHFDTGTQG